MCPREPSGVQRGKKLHFQKPEKSWSFLMFLDPEASQENLKRPEIFPETPKETPKSVPKIGQKVVKK